MEIKKSFKADLRNKRGLLLEIGLVVALSLVIVAFTYTPDEYRIQKVAVDVMPVDIGVTRGVGDLHSRISILMRLSK